MTTDFDDIGRRIKDTYRQVADESGPTEDDIKVALTTLVGAWDQVAESVAGVLKDPALRQQIKDAAGSLASALGTTITDLGSVLRRNVDPEEEE